ncbi:MAG: hypothetical protein ACHQTF_08790 [Gemmatimonadales bacterium]
MTGGLVGGTTRGDRAILRSCTYVMAWLMTCAPRALRRSAVYPHAGHIALS